MPASQDTKYIFVSQKRPPVPQIEKDVVSPEKVVAFLFHTDATRALGFYKPNEANHLISAEWIAIHGDNGVSYSLKLYLNVKTGRGSDETIVIGAESRFWADIVNGARITETIIFVPWPKYPEPKS